MLRLNFEVRRDGAKRWDAQPMLLMRMGAKG